MNHTLGATLRALRPVLALAVVWGGFALLLGGSFTAPENQRLMLQQTAVVGTAAVGATLIIILGGIDLSVGASIALGTMLIASLINEGFPEWLAALGGVAGAATCGVFIGALVTGHLARALGVVAAVAGAVWVCPRIHATLHAAGVSDPWAVLGAALTASAAWGLVPLSTKLPWRVKPVSAFIVTLGLWGALRGLAKGLGGNQMIVPRTLEHLDGLMVPHASGVFAWLAPGVWIMLGVALLAAALLRFTTLGRQTLAIGGNEHAARVCGVRVDQVKWSVYALGVACAGLAGVLQFSNLTVGDPTTAGGYELRVIAAVVIGGASLAGGRGSVLGSLIGALLMTVVDNGCNKLELANWVQEIATGAIIVLAVIVDQARSRAGSGRGAAG